MLWTLQKNHEENGIETKKEKDYCCILLCRQSTSQHKLWEHQNLQQKEKVLKQGEMAGAWLPAVLNIGQRATSTIQAIMTFWYELLPLSTKCKL